MTDIWMDLLEDLDLGEAESRTVKRLSAAVDGFLEAVENGD